MIIFIIMLNIFCGLW